jgi:hypothetical protein
VKRITHALAALYTVATFALLAYAVYASRRGDTAEVVVFGCCAILFGCAIGHHTYHRDELRFARVRLERATRPPGPHAAAIADEIALGWQALAEACCLSAAVSAGADHDPDHCTRKDQTT